MSEEIKNLILVGSGKGGVLAPHADFHHYHQLELFRRINVLLYFNVDWREADGGSLELFGKANEDPVERIVPAYGRMVMFLTDNKSIHGFREPIARPDTDRISLALYYYTSEETRSFSGSGDTLWQEHGKVSGMSFLRLIIYKGMLRAAALLSRIAHAANPNLQKKPRKAD
ncbi:MAG: 2OG-Fe(II) oxygenase [Verrucomicrobiaceae bacterium]|nr:MAG: 2OG-Fe(II) oxygenase [Verrucomicrobiaceae bacterium]